MKICQFPSTTAQKRLERIVSREALLPQKEMNRVKRILQEVRKEGDTAVNRYTRQFDAKKITVEQTIVTNKDLAAAKKAVGKGFMRALNRAASNICAFHEKQKPNSWMTAQRPGTLTGQMVHPVDAAGIYVPGATGGATPLVSSVLMCAIPAQIAGVTRVVMATPPRPDGSVTPELLVAAQKANVDMIFKMGSAWAIGALAYGTETIPKVDVIVGPGNIYVTLAKRMVSGKVGIDMIAGPSEILILADKTADPDHVAADLLSQAEHDVLASSILVTPSPSLATGVKVALGKQVTALERRAIAAESLKRFGAAFVVPDLAIAIDLANQIAPEHLQLYIQNPFDYVDQLRHAGAIFIGPYTPEPVGDYVAGPNHVLPTSGTARFSSALGVETFLKRTSLVYYSKAAFQKEAQTIIRLADAEGLGAHANSVAIRLK